MLGQVRQDPVNHTRSGLKFKSNTAKVYEAQNPCQAVSWDVVTNVKILMEETSKAK